MAPKMANFCDPSEKVQAAARPNPNEADVIELGPIGSGKINFVNADEK